MLDARLINSLSGDTARGFRPEPIERWRNRLRPDEVAVIRRLTRRVASRYGYPTDFPPHSAARTMHVYARGLAGVPRAVLANRDRQANLAAYVWTRVAPR